MSLVQTSKGNGGNYVNNIVLAMGSSVTAGSLLVAAITVADSVDITSVTDTRSNTWTKIAGTAGATNGRGISMWYVKNAAAGSTTITANLGTGVDFQDLCIIVREYSGMDTSAPFDKHSITQETTDLQSHTSGATAATTQASEIVVCAGSAPENPSTYSAGSGYGNLTTQVGFDSFTCMAMEDKTISSTGAQTGTFTTTSFMKGSYVVATFKTASAPVNNPRGFFALMQ